MRRRAVLEERAASAAAAVAQRTATAAAGSVVFVTVRSAELPPLPRNGTNVSATVLAEAGAGRGPKGRRVTGPPANAARTGA